MNAFRISLDFCGSSTRLVLLFTTAQLVTKRALICLIRSSYDRRNPLDKFENWPRADFSSKHGKLLDLTPSDASRSIMRELKLVRNSSGSVLPSLGLMHDTWNFFGTVVSRIHEAKGCSDDPFVGE